MVKPKMEWDPSWDDDWRSATETLSEALGKEGPVDPKKAVEYYKYGFSVARRHPTHEWPEIEREMYQDYMTGELEDDESWEESRGWAKKGWLTGTHAS